MTYTAELCSSSIVLNKLFDCFLRRKRWDDQRDHARPDGSDVCAEDAKLIFALKRHEIGGAFRQNLRRERWDDQRDHIRPDGSDICAEDARY